MRTLSSVLWFALALQFPPRASAQTLPTEVSSFDDVRAVASQYCYTCHQGQKPAGKLDLTRFKTFDSVLEERPEWDKLVARLRNAEMPPRGAPAPSLELRGKMASWLETNLRAAACANGITPGPAPLRRLNRDEYAATIRDLLNIHINAGHNLPADGAGGEGFDNAAETLFLSPIYAEKYLDAAKEALDYAAKEPKARETFMIAQPGAGMTPEQAAHRILEKFLPRAFRRPVSVREQDRYFALFKTALARKESFEDSILYALKGVLISPEFLFRIERPNPDAVPRLLGDYELAARLSYFLWGSTPDQTLTDLAAQGKLHEPDVLRAQVNRLLSGGTKTVDGDKVRVITDGKLYEFATRFVEQWLNTRELARDIRPDRDLFPQYYNVELQTAIRQEPIVFFQEVIADNLSLLNFLDSNFIMVDQVLAKHYGLKGLGRLRTELVKRDLPPDSHRGGLLGMAATAVVSSYPTRTSPVLRGKWVLESLLGTPPPPPPPNVPLLKEASAAGGPQTVRERLMLHRQNPACSSCHASIDPIGFGLENYDALGRWRTDEGGKPIDTKGELPDGTTFDGPEQLKAVLLARKDVFVRHLASKVLGYALGRGLTTQDQCVVDEIMAQLRQNDYKSHVLIEGIVLSMPFRYQAAADPGARVARGSN